MPALRSMPPAKPVKTERTHEENQERAYIAASRRSDRSLEARVESARRASEIHKRRTGRSLRVTEQDVVNEEMYEEEDDDLPMQYRRLTAHLQTSNADFDRRLQAYLTNHVAMRAGLMGGGGAIDPFPNTQLSGGHFMNPSMMQIPQNAFANPMLPPSMSARGMSYRQSPYPINAPRHNDHTRSASIANPQNQTAWQQQRTTSSSHASPVDNVKVEDRRMSMPAQPMLPHTPTSQQGGPSPNAGHVSPAVSRTSSSHNLTSPHNAFPATSGSPQQQPSPPKQPQPSRHSSFMGAPMRTPSYGFDAGYQNQLPFSASLPMESQQLLAGNPAFDYGGDAFGLNFAQAQTGPGAQQPFYSYNPNGNKQKSSPPTTYAGMDQTLAPASNMLSSLNTSCNAFDQTSTSPSIDSSIASYPPSAGFDGFGFDPSFVMDPLKMASSAGSSAQLTPSADADWNSFISSGMFDEVPAA